MDSWVISIVKSAVMNMGVQISVQRPCFNSFGYVPKRGTAVLYGCMFKFLKNCQTVFHTSCIISHSHQQCMRVVISKLSFNGCQGD